MLEYPSAEDLRKGYAGSASWREVGAVGEHPSIAVLISGRGSNLKALIDAVGSGSLQARLRVVVSNQSDAGGLEHARAAGIETVVLSHTAFGSRAEYDAALVGSLSARGVKLVCLAGFMRVVGPEFCVAFPLGVVNIHPSLLPAFPGLHAQAQALRHGVKVSGATVHLVTPELDAGPIVLQQAVPVLDDDTESTLSARILGAEHHIYPEAVQRLLSTSWHVEGRRLVFSK
jgi:phosphoribosylglycinamide formyltransferase-1